MDLAPLGAIFAPLQGRFEITLRAPISARYLKLVTRPLSPAATTDKNLVDIVVTELQAYLVTPITRSTGWQGSNSELFTFGGRTQLGGRPDLSYDFSLQLSRAGQSEAPSRETWLVSNGLNFSRQLQPVVLLSTRVARQDFDLGRGHEGAILYSASLAADELATLSHTLSYSGQINQAAAGTTTANSVSLFNRATPYRGIGLLAGGSWGTATNLSGQTSRSNVITLNATLEPHRALTLGGTYGRNGSVTLGGGLPTTVSRQQIIQGTVSFSPFPALYFSGGIQRTITELQGFTLVNLASGFSPFPGGALQFTLAFNETLDSNNAVTRLITPGLRWNITRSAVLSSSYGFVDSTGPQTNLHTRTFDVNLRIQL